MFPDRMAKEPPIFGLLWLFTLSYVVAASSLSLGTGLSQFIPACAEQCFLSFVNVNYGVSTCGNQPSRECLCTHASASGFTIGEGAVQCITAERAIEFCSINEASRSVIQEAALMCNDVEDAIQATHGTITATLVLPPPGGNGIVTVPFPETTLLPGKTSTSTSTSTSVGFSTITRDRTTTLPTRSTTTFIFPSTSTSFSLPTTVITSTTRISTTQTSATETNTPVGAPTGSDNDKGSDDLSKGQVAGISVGVAAAAGVAVGAIFLSRYYRKKKFPNVKTGFLPMRDTWGYKFDKRSGGRGSGTGGSDTSSWITQQIHRPLDPDSLPPIPRRYNHTSWRPSTIGLAISKPREKEVERTPPRRFSRLLPAKPVLSLSLPKSDSPPLSQQIENFTPPVALAVPQPTFQNNRTQPTAPPRLVIPKTNNFMAVPPPGSYNRESTMTEFEEDGGMSLSSGGQVWRPPSAAPQSATYYVADKHGNWVLGNTKRSSQIAELDAVSPLTAQPKTAASDLNPFRGSPNDNDAFGLDAPPGPVPPPKDTTSVLAPPAEITRSSSVYSQQSGVPRALFSSTPSNPRGSSGSGIRRSLSRSLTRPRAPSTDSGITTFTTSSEDTDDPSPPAEPPALQGNNLSPVAESPGSGSGRSPVTYPKIPGREPSIADRRANNPNNLAPPAPPPPAALRSMYFPPGQPSPTLGIMHPPQPSGPGLSSYNVPRRGRQGVENPGLVRSGSPTMRVVEPSPEPDDRNLLPSARPISRVPSYGNAYSQPQQQPPRQPQYPYMQQRPPRQQQQYPPRQQGPYPPFPSNRPISNRLPPLTKPSLYPLTTDQPPLPPPPPMDPNSAHQPSPSSARTDSTASSLLAKRLGSDRAANMALQDPAAAAHSKWRRDENGMLMTPRRPGDLPATPTWVPKLTPTRRGDDLFLDVR